jgi:hypothetical protein
MLAAQLEESSVKKPHQEEAARVGASDWRLNAKPRDPGSNGWAQSKALFRKVRASGQAMEAERQKPRDWQRHSWARRRGARQEAARTEAKRLG